MAITNPTKYVSVQRLGRFETKLAAKYQTQAITAITGLSAGTVEAALAELLGKIQAIPSAIIPKGTRTFSQLAPSTDLAAGNLGFMWNISDAFTTTSDFAEGAGNSIPAGANVYVANVGTTAEPSYKYDIFQGMYDLSGYALKSEMAIEDVSGDATKKEITLKSGLSQQVVVAHQDISGKQDTLVSGTNIKTINNESILGSGNITIQGGSGSQVQSDWNQSDNTAVDYIKNKPTIPVIPSNLAYTSNDNGEGIIPSDGIRAVTVTSAATMTISPDVVTVIDGAVGTAAITLQVPQDNLAHVWDILMTTDSTVAITFAMSNSATILTPSGFSVGASKAVEISVIGVGTKYYLRYGEFA